MSCPYSNLGNSKGLTASVMGGPKFTGDSVYVLRGGTPQSQK